MHWSRVVDVPLGALVRLFALVAPPIAAERLARIVFPLLLQVLLILAFVRAARLLCGPKALVPALLVITLNGFQFGQFMAGRIDHHAPQIVLLVTFVGMAIAGLGGAGRGAALGCAAAMAVSLAISLENLPFMAVTITALVVVWLWRGPDLAGFITSFGLGLAGFTVLVFAATVPPARYAVVANDALSAPHVLLAAMGGIGLAGAAAFEPLRYSLRRRGFTMLGLAAVTIGVVILLCPGFPASPYAGVDPVVRDLWLRHVSEALPLLETLQSHPATAVLIVVPLGAAALAALGALVTSQPNRRAAWALIVALICTGIAGACWEVRIASSVVPLAALGGVWAVTRAAAWQATGLLRSPIVRMLLVLWPFCPVLCAMLPTPGDEPAVTQATADAQACREPAAFEPLATLAAGLAFAPIDIGAQLLAFTDLSVVAGPYHRNNLGNRAVIDGFEAPPALAQARIKASAARYVMICKGDAHVIEIARAAPESLAAQLLAEQAPSWLQRVSLEPTPYQVYRMK